MSIFDGITYIEDDIIEKSLDTKLKAQLSKRKVWGSIAACAVVVIGIGSGMVLQNFSLSGAMPEAEAQDILGICGNHSRQ